MAGSAMLKHAGFDFKIKRPKGCGIIGSYLISFVPGREYSRLDGCQAASQSGYRSELYRKLIQDTDLKTSSSEEARALGDIGVDHIGVPSR